MRNGEHWRRRAPDPGESKFQCCHYCGRVPASVERWTPWYAYEDRTLQQWPTCERCYDIACRPGYVLDMDAIDEMVERMVEKQVALHARFREQQATVRMLRWDGTVEEEFVFR